MKNNSEKNKFEVAVFGGGCFWCLEAVFAKLKGVKSVISGFAGGTPPAGRKHPTYEEVCSGKTGHAEVTKVEYDPKIVTYGDLLSVFFAMHDPTTLDRQGADVGTQYRSIILYNTEEQKKEAEGFIEKLTSDKIFGKPIVTELKPLNIFYPAEKYHQGYFANNPAKPYCQINISPKIEKLREKFLKMVE